jgi:hypothetical protein
MGPQPQRIDHDRQDFMGAVMSSSLAPVADKLGKLLRLLSSDRDGEIVGAARAIVRTLDGAGLDIHALAEGIGAPADSKKKFSEADALEIYRRGVEDGKRAAEFWFRSVDEPTWHEIAGECAAHDECLRDERERQFVRDMVRWTVRGGEPTEKQAHWLRAIYARVRQ